MSPTNPISTINLIKQELRGVNTSGDRWLYAIGRWYGGRYTIKEISGNGIWQEYRCPDAAKGLFQKEDEDNVADKTAQQEISDGWQDNGEKASDV